MPCVATARGVKANAYPLFNDATDNNPCGRATVTTVNGVSVSAHSMCLAHLAQKLGLAVIQAPIV